VIVSAFRPRSRELSRVPIFRDRQKMLAAPVPQVVWRAILEYMNREKGYPAELLAIEIDLDWVQKGTLRKRERGRKRERRRERERARNWMNASGSLLMGALNTHESSCTGLIFDFRTGDTLKISEHGVVFQAIT